MKLTVFAVSTLLALATAQESSSTTDSSTTTTSLTPQASCATKCAAKDICCIAGCYSVPCPSDSQANDTVTCVAHCPQGNGSASDTDAYAKCQNGCYSSYFLSTTGTASTTTGSSATGTTTDASATGTASESGSETGSATSSSTASGSSTSETANVAVSQLKMGASAAGLIGLVVAALAL